MPSFTRSRDRWVIAAAVCAITAVGVCEASAQDVEPGTRVRVTAPSASVVRRVANVERFDSDSLVLIGSGMARRPGQPPPQRWVVPTDLLTELEVSQGRDNDMTKGFLIGVGAGALVGFAGIDFGKGSACSGSGDYASLCAFIVGGAAVAGGLVGGVLGAATSEEYWVPVPLSSAPPAAVRP